MAKVSVGLRGWRFDEEEIFTDDEELKPLDEIPEEPRERLVRLVSLVEEPCDVCYLEHGEAEVHRCNQAEIVYGEPKGEVLLCPEHEPNLIYWFRGGGRQRARRRPRVRRPLPRVGRRGQRGPGWVRPVEHVEEDPDGLPDLPDQQDIQERVEQDFDGDRIDILELAGETDDEEEGTADKLTEDDLAESGVNLSTDYPSNR